MRLTRYLDAVREKTQLSERGFYPTLAQHIIEGVLGYPERAYRVEPRRQQGLPDLQLLTDQNEAWVVGEVKLDDAEIRDPARRRAVWEDQVVRYLQPETVHVALVAPHTFLVFDVSGRLRGGATIEPDRLVDVGTGAEHDLTDANLRGLLSLISYDEAVSRRKYEQFRHGEAPSGYLPLTEATLPHFQATFQFASDLLVRFARQAWEALAAEYREFLAEMAQIEERSSWVGQDEKGQRALQKQRYRTRRRYRLARQIHEDDYPQFLYSQAYAGTRDPADFLEVYLTDTVYVVLSRLLFVRLCEDLGLVKKKVSNQGLATWAALVDNLEGLYQDLLTIAFRDAGRVYSRLFEATVFDWYAETDGELSELLERILYRLNAFAFSGVDRDLLGKIYQEFLPPQKRKRLGEFYTDDEIVDYILWRVGLAEDPHLESRLVLDPACGSNTFGVRAAARLLARFSDSPPQHQIERVRDVLVGYDINPFAVFIAQMSLLFTVLPQYREAKTAAPSFQLPPFRVHNLNSLLEDLQPDLAGVAEVADPDVDSAPGRFDYVVGNPPYVRNERVPEGDREALAERYGAVRHKNTDLSVYFIHRAVSHWLREDGRLGMVVSIGLANSDATRKLREYLRQWRVDEVVSLEWMATELFAGADIVPMLLFVSRARRESADTVAVVSGLRTKADLQRCLADPSFREHHTSVLPRKDWEELSPFGDWCLEAKQEDVALLQALRAVPTIGGAGVASAHYGIKVGSSPRAAAAVVAGDEAPADSLPFLKGLDVARWGLSAPENALLRASLADVSDASIWSWWPEARVGAPRPSDAACLVLPGVYVTLVAAVLDPSSCCANDSTRILVPESVTAHALCAVVNSLPARYYHFLTMRAAILLRRRSTIYPRAIENLPWPQLDAPQLSRLDSLSREAHAVSAEADADEVRLAAAAATTWSDTRRASVVLDFSGWPEEAQVAPGVAAKARVAEGALVLGAACVRGDEPGLKLLAWLLAGQERPLSLESAGAVALPRDPGARTAAVAAIEARVGARGTLLGRLAEVEHEVDELVMGGLGLTGEQQACLRRRCEDFPLSETVLRPRYLWSEDRKRQALRRYDPGRRYQ